MPQIHNALYIAFEKNELSQQMNSILRPHLDSAVSTIKSISKFLIATHLFNEYCLEITLTCGPSMLPTLSTTGDTLLIDRRPNLPTWFSRYVLRQDFGVKLNDVVVARSPKNPEETICKRVLALPGQKNKSGEVMPPGRVWLEGDNKMNSTDSRDYGPVPMAAIEGVVLCRIWPPSKAGVLVTPNEVVAVVVEKETVGMVGARRLGKVEVRTGEVMAGAREAATSAKMSEAIPSAKTSEAMQYAKSSEAVTNKKASEAMTSAKLSEAVTIAKSNEAVMHAKSNEAVVHAKSSEAMTNAKLGEAMTGAKLSEAVKNAKSSEVITSVVESKNDVGDVAGVEVTKLIGSPMSSSNSIVRHHDV